ncbi:MAG: glycosyltransferase family 2 protein [Coriobacteriia bacterium]
MSASVTVVIPNWNGLVHLEECLTALREQTLTPARVVIVDNASDDDSELFVSERFPEVDWIQMPKNGGFAYAVNEGIRCADTTYVALLNNDTAVESTWLEELVAALERHPGYDIAASRMVLYYDRHLMNAAGDVYRLLRGAGRNRGILRPVERFGEPCRVLGACAGAALYRRSLFDEIGLFDEDFFLMSEDTDINIRALIAGKKCVYVPTAIVYHKMRATIDSEPSKRMAMLALRNEAIVVGKDLPMAGVVIVLAMYGWRLFRSTFPVRPDKWHMIPGLLRTVRERTAADIQGFRMGWAKREEVWRTRRASRLVILRWLFKGTGRLTD